MALKIMFAIASEAPAVPTVEAYARGDHAPSRIRAIDRRPIEETGASRSDGGKRLRWYVFWTVTQVLGATGRLSAFTGAASLDDLIEDYSLYIDERTEDDFLVASEFSLLTRVRDELVALHRRNPKVWDAPGLAEVESEDALVRACRNLVFELMRNGLPPYPFD